MRTLLDENVPEELGREFEAIAAIHIEAIGHKGVANGELLAIARADYDLLITFDKGLPHQHSHAGQALRILVLRLTDNKKETVLEFAKGIKDKGLSLAAGEHGEFWPPVESGA